MKISCEHARPLVPGYLDGELSEVQASPLRSHLLDCPKCREVAKEEKSLKRWFDTASEPIRVPVGFAARVARRALAGDPGVLVPEPAPASLVGRSRAPLLPFLLAATAVAAAILLVLAVAIQRENLPRTNGLEATPRPPWLDQAQPAENVPPVAAPGPRGRKSGN